MPKTIKIKENSLIFYNCWKIAFKFKIERISFSTKSDGKVNLIKGKTELKEIFEFRAWKIFSKSMRESNFWRQKLKATHFPNNR